MVFPETTHVRQPMRAAYSPQVSRLRACTAIAALVKGYVREYPTEDTARLRMMTRGNWISVGILDFFSAVLFAMDRTIGASIWLTERIRGDVDRLDSEGAEAVSAPASILSCRRVRILSCQTRSRIVSY